MATATLTRRRRQGSNGAGSRSDAYQDVTDRIVAALEQGVVPWHRPWRTVGGPRSYSGRPYRGINVWLLELEELEHGYSDPRWITFNAAKQAGGTVRKGERSTPVYLWRRILVKDRDAEPTEDGEPGTKPIWLLRSYRVFNVAQCDGLAEWIPPALEEHNPIESADAIVTRYLEDGGPSYSQGGDRAYYSPAQDAVRVPVVGAFESAGAFYGTLFHELVHSTGHSSRLARPELEAPGFGSEPYAREELVAELGAAMLCGAAGVDRGELAESASYIASWLRALRDDRRLIVSASAAAQRAADMVRGVTFEDREQPEEQGHKGAGATSAPERRPVPADILTTHKPMVARYRGQCGYCGVDIRQGATIHYSRKAEPADRVACAACVAGLEAPASPAPVVLPEPVPALKEPRAPGARTYSIPGTTFTATVEDPEDVAGAIKLEGRKRKAPIILEDRRKMAGRLEELVAGKRPPRPTKPQAVRGTSLAPVSRSDVPYWRQSAGGTFATRQRAAYVEATGREPRTVGDVLRARGVTDAGELERARAQWEYRGKSSGDPLELFAEPVRELVAA